MDIKISLILHFTCQNSFYKEKQIITNQWSKCFKKKKEQLCIPGGHINECSY